MATENPMRILESRRPGQWVSSVDELGLLLKGQKVPNRSGSAPPSMEGSFTAFGNLIYRQTGGWDLGSTSMDSALLNCQSEEQIRADPAYFAYYSSNVNLNPRLPPPIVSRENRHLTHRIGASNDGNGDRRVPFPLSTHIEEPEDESSTRNYVDKFAELSGPKLVALAGQHKSLVDLIQDDFPRTPSPLYSQSCLSAVEEPTKCNIQSIGLENLSLDVSKTGLSEAASNSSSILSFEETSYLENNEETGVSKKPETIEGASSSYQNGLDKGQFRPRLSPLEVQTVPLTPPLYASAAAYMAQGSPFYANFNSSGMYSPQYSIGNYALGSAFLPPNMPGYPGTAGLSAAEIPQLGHHGLMMHHPSFADHFQMRYFQHPVDDAFNAPGQYLHFSSTSMVGGQGDPSTIASYFGDQKFQAHNTPNRGKIGVPNNSYYGSPAPVGFVPQFPVSPLGSPIGGAAYPFGRRSEMRFLQGWQMQRGGSDNFNEPKKHSFLDELKANSARKIDISDIAGRVVEFSVDQHGSRFIQQKLENCSAEEKDSVFAEVLPHASKLMTDVFGNYVIQKFFEHGSQDQRKELAYQLTRKMLPLSLQMYGCRVIQKALEVIDLDQKTELVHELDGHVMTCVRDQNGNHVIQKCIECVPTQSIRFILLAFQGQVATLSTHPYGCRVIQRVLEHCSDDSQSQCIVDEILESAHVLAQDQYGNYVTQHVLERGKPHERKRIISKLTGKVVQLSQHKYASNVVEKCLEHGDPADQELLIGEILAQSDGNDSLLTMMKDQFANYVVQKILDISNDEQCSILLNRIKVHLPALRKYTYGKHIVARFEQLSGEDVETLS